MGTGSGDNKNNDIQHPAPIAVGKSSSINKVTVKLAEEEDCKEDIRRTCKDARNNFAILECLQNERRDLREVLNDKCNHLVWGYKMNLTQSGRIEELARDVCENELQQHTECMQSGSGSKIPGHTISCMTEQLDNIKDERCRQYLLRLAAIVFSDYRYIKSMVEDCRDDIDRLQCGRLRSGAVGQQQEGSQVNHSQGYTIECLTTQVNKLTPQCQKEILRLAELQSDDFHLDRPLFFACRDDREKFCENIRSGDGRVYRCLMKHKMDRRMSKECSDQLTRRQQLTVQDYKANRGLVRACRAAITKYQCRRHSADDSHQVKLSKILLCLEKAVRDGEVLDGSCREEMLEHRKQLMADHQLSPNLVSACNKELTENCARVGETGERTLHCLMKLARSRKTISEQCWMELEMVVKETDAGEDWRVDPVLHEACLSVVESACKDIRGGNARVMRCLMRHLSSPEMPDTCEAALLEIQYFISRDWKLDPQLHTACFNDASRLCHAKRDWADTTQNSNNPQRGAQVLPCLFRHAYHPKDTLRLDPVCLQEVQRVMHERAAYVELHPEIEMACMEPLARLCSHDTGPGEEMRCLQTNLEGLEGECRSAVTNYTEAEAKDSKLNSQLTIHCGKAITQMCGGESQSSGDDDTLMDCLIRHKNVEAMRPYKKCRAVIEDFQLVALKDYTFSPKFKEACQGDVASLCSKPKNKADVVECLSAAVREAVLKQTSHQVSRECRQQLRQQLIQRHENIKFDPALQKGCAKDISSFCASVTSGRGAVLECLRNHRAQLSSPCHGLIFVREQEELQDPGTDVVLMSACRQMRQLFCHDSESDQLLYCLRDNKDQPNFNSNCRLVVVRRLVEQTTDARLDPQLLNSCRKDLGKFCSKHFDKLNTNATELNGLLTECLRKQLPSRKLSLSCRKKMLLITRSSALNYKMDPVLTQTCSNDIKVLCADETESHMEECLKLALEQGRIKEEGCSIHLAHIIESQRADIHSDPLLNKACGIDDNKFCVNKEEGYHLACLMDVLDRNPQGLQAECRETLRKRREMYNTAMKLTNIASIGELVGHVSRSSERTYLLLVLASVVGIIFIGGLFCGRATKRYKILKNR
ncbi:hypothetical protein Pcinc_010433 [Petrolisthes cinctipes]|uniref:Golgi apparatus protein 1 n=1 Tax=Petrolisthes cinctipes TaxID=88211 RepID=A0AAE1KUI8_PETCI|nr:hypothetical protein Pcinc_010433 [Petrolisthes cinctipes]